MPNELQRLLALNLKILRTRRGITQDELAERAGISKNYLAEIETARKYPSSEVFLRLARGLDVRPWQLIRDGERLPVGATGDPGFGDQDLVRELSDVIERYRTRKRDRS